jgi:5,10-methylenetetrahydrofolate reductase
MKPREFGKCLREACSRPIDLVINRVVVYRTIAQQKDWLKNSYRDFGIRNLVLVGGELEPENYPGPSVSAMANLITEEVNSHLPEEEAWVCGGIAIPSRRLMDPEFDEPNRMFKKTQAGIEFFSTQIIYEPDSICRLLKDYSGICREKSEYPKRVFISMAPVQDAKHIQFMRWLGVEIPPGIEGELLRDKDRVGSCSLDVCCRFFRQIIDFNSELDQPVPLGLNISPLIRSNFDLGVKLVDRLSSLR